jgi:uncharacterized protein (TIGR00290 family)
MKAFVSWSGGKDCMLALHRFLKNNSNAVSHLVNMCENNSEYSRSHGIKKSLIMDQADSIGVPIVQETIGNSYEANFKKVISELKLEGVKAGIFGDIYLQEHRTWIDRVCSEMNIEAIFPLWGEDTKGLLNEFISEGFKTIVVVIDNTKLSTQWLGRKIDNEFLNDIVKQENIDACAEKGEYHSFVYDGPLFKKPIPFIKGKKFTESQNTYLELICN